MSHLLSQLASLTFGQMILVGCCILLAFFFAALVWQTFRIPRWKKPQKTINPEQEFVRKDPVLSHTLNKAEKLEGLLQEDIDNLKKDLDQERESVTLAVQALKNIALEKKFPQTLFQIYSEMKAFPKKNQEAQQVDMEWHRKVGISDLEVVPIIGKNGLSITFVLLRHVYRLEAILHHYARIHFVELSLLDSNHAKLMVARVKPDQSLGRVATENAVMEMSNGEWIDDMIACRLLMDRRQSELSLIAGHHEVEQLKSKFKFQSSFKKKS
jgi:hypothetical protein